MRELHCHHPFDIETSTFQFSDNYKTLYIMLSFARKVFIIRSNSIAKIIDLF